MGVISWIICLGNITWRLFTKECLSHVCAEKCTDTELAYRSIRGKIESVCSKRGWYKIGIWNWSWVVFFASMAYSVLKTCSGPRNKCKGQSSQVNIFLTWTVSPLGKCCSTLPVMEIHFLKHSLIALISPGDIFVNHSDKGKCFFKTWSNRVLMPKEYFSRKITGLVWCISTSSMSQSVNRRTDKN